MELSDADMCRTRTLVRFERGAATGPRTEPTRRPERRDMPVRADSHGAGRMRIRVVGSIIALGALLAPPAAIRLAAQDIVICPEDMDPVLTGLAGGVQDTIQGIIISGATISATWADAQGQRRWVSVQTDHRGAYVLCGLPSGTSLTVQARVALSVTQPVVVNIAPGPPAGWDIGMGVEMRTAESPFHVPGRIVGRVVDRRSGRPVQAVTVTLVDEDQQRATDATAATPSTKSIPASIRWPSNTWPTRTSIRWSSFRATGPFR